MTLSLLVLSLILILALSAAYLFTRFRRFAFIQKLSQTHKRLSLLLCLAPFLLMGVFLCADALHTLVAALHLVLFWCLFDLLGFLFRKITGKHVRRYWAGGLAVLFTAVYLSVGVFFAYHVFETRYVLSTAKALAEPLRIVQISDSHLGVTLDGEAFAKEMEKVQQAQPDAVVITGDFVDDDSRYADMLAACEALGRLETSCGVYFVFGNHDEGYFGTRDFSVSQLREALEASGVVILEDETVSIAENVYLIGRRDRSSAGRASMAQLMENLEKDHYAIVLDHQPNDYDHQAAAGADLVLSGHTHGGHIFPAGLIGLLMGANDQVYGLQSRENTDFIVSSGISGWAIRMKTGAVSEYVIIDIVPDD